MPQKNFNDVSETFKNFYLLRQINLSLTQIFP